MNDDNTINDNPMDHETAAAEAAQNELDARADEMIKSAMADSEDADEATAAGPVAAETNQAGEPDTNSTIDEDSAEQSEPVDESAPETVDAQSQDAQEQEAQTQEAQPKGPKKRFDDVSYDRAYRVNVYYRVEDGQYGLHCAELGDLNVQAETRALALEQADQALEDRIADYAVRGLELPKPFDLDGRQDYSGEITLKIGKSLHRDLSVAARREHVSLNHLAAELLSAGMARLRMEGRPLPGRNDQSRNPRKDRATGRGTNRPGGRRDTRRRGGMTEDRYKQVMEDKGAFMEYVRGLDGEGNNTRGGNRGRRKR